MARDISVDELAQWRQSGKPFVLLDVREPVELERASISDAVHIPMREVPARTAELQKGSTIAVLCHHGGRSAAVADFLEAQGFTDVANVDGGIDAFAERIDPTIPRY